MAGTARRAGHTLWQAAVASGGVATITDAVSHNALNVNVAEQAGGVMAIAVGSAGLSALKGAVVSYVQKRSASKAATFERIVAVEVSKRLQGLLQVPPTVSDAPVAVPGTGNALPDAGAHVA